MYTPPGLTNDDKTAGTASSATWSTPSNTGALDGSFAVCGPSATRQILYLSNFALSGNSKWRLAEMWWQEFHVNGPAGERLLTAYTLDGVNRISDWLYTPPMTGILANLGPIELPVQLLDPSFFADPEFGLLIAREPAGSGNVQLDYALLRASTQRWDTYPMWEQPVDDEDAKAGRTCAISGIWFPGSMLRETERGLIGEPWAGED